MNKDKNLENKLEQKLQPWKSVTLSEEEKERMKTFLSSYIDLKPAKEKPVKSKWFADAPLFFRIAAPAFALAIFFVSGGAVMAEKSLPGDSLYALKTTFEDVRGRLIVSPESKIRWNTARVERRLAEAQSLASNGRLSKEVAAGLAENVDSYTTSIEGGLSDLRSNNKSIVALEIDGEYRSTVRMYKNLLDQVSEESEDLIALLESITADYDVAVAFDSREVAPFSVELSTEGDSDDTPEADARTMVDADEGEELQGTEIARTEPDPSLDELGDESSLSSDDEVSEISTVSLLVEDGSEQELDSSVEVFMKSTSEVGSLTNSEIFSLPIETLETFISARLGKAEASLKNAKLNKELKDELKERLARASEIYESGKKERGGLSEEAARSHYRRALKLVEDVQAAIRVSGSVMQEEILRSLPEISLLIRDEFQKDVEFRAKGELNKRLKSLGL